MDLITQITLGAAVGEATLGKKIGNKAMLIGALGGIIPDLDVLANPFLSPEMGLAFHRSYTHSFMFVLLLAPALAWLFNKGFRKHEIGFKKWFILFFLALFTHIILDLFTNYGTQIFLPFSNFRVAFNNISIVDVFYTIPLIVSLIAVSFINKSKKIRQIIIATSLILTTSYIGYTLINKYNTHQHFTQQLHSQNIDYNRLMTNPGILTNFLWYGVAESDSGYYFAYSSVFDKQERIDFEYYAKNKHLYSEFKNDAIFEKLKWFSNDYFIVEKSDNGLVYIDMRFGKMNIHETNPLKAFIFNFNLSFDANNKLSFTQIRETDDVDLKAGIRQLINRIKGN